jgi:hypothetical protein
MCCSVTVGKHVNEIRANGRQPPITIEKLLDAMFSFGSSPRLYKEDPRSAEKVEVQNIRRTITT